MKNRRLLLLLLIIVPLGIGILYYYFLREPIIVFSWLKSDNFYIPSSITQYFDFLPTFVHVFSFSLLTWWALDKSYEKTSVLIWVVINLVFEIGQALDHKYLIYFPDIIQKYCINGTFAYDDIVSIFVAGGLAYWVMRRFSLK